MDENDMSGYFAIGIENNKTPMNLGTLWRSAFLFDAKFIFTINVRYKKQGSDTCKTWRQLPYFAFATVTDFLEHRPADCELVGIEMIVGAIDIRDFKHPKRAIYVLGAEDSGLSNKIISSCQYLIKIPTAFSLNVASAGTVVLYDRLAKQERLT